MHLSTQRKISFGTLAVALVGFVVDRVAFTPSGAEAQPPQASLLIHPTGPAGSSNAHASDASPAAQEADARLAGLSVIADRLQRATSQLDAPQGSDAFEPASWIGTVQVKASTAPDAAAVVNAFRQKHKVLAVMKSGRGAIALVDGRTVRKGQVLDGFKLAEVRERSVVFESANGPIELFVAGAAPAGDAADNLEIVPSPARDQAGSVTR